MERNRYKKITFAKGYDKSLAEFKKEFETDFHFRTLPKKEKDKEMRKAWKIATKGNAPKKKAKPKKSKDEPKASPEQSEKPIEGKHSE